MQQVNTIPGQSPRLKGNRFNVPASEQEVSAVKRARELLLDTLPLNGYRLLQTSNATTTSFQKEIKQRMVLTAAVRKIRRAVYRVETTRFYVKEAKLTSYCRDVHFSDLVPALEDLLSKGHDSLDVTVGRSHDN